MLKDVKQGGVDKKTGTELYFNFEQLTTIAPRFGVGTMNIVHADDAAGGRAGGDDSRGGRRRSIRRCRS